MNPEDTKALIKEMKEVFPTTEKMIEEMKEVFPTAEMMNNSFQATQDQISALRTGLAGNIAEVRTDLAQLEDRVEDVRETLSKVPSGPDMEASLEHAFEKTYKLATLQVEHDRMKKVISEKLNVEI